MSWNRSDLFGTPPKFNIAPEKGTFQEEASLPTTVFQGRAVKLQECKCFIGCFD